MPLSSTSVENCTLVIGKHSFPLPKFSTKITIWELKQIINGETGVFPNVLCNSAFIDEGIELQNNSYVKDFVTHGDTLVVLDPPDIQQHPPPPQANRYEDVTITLEPPQIQQPYVPPYVPPPYVPPYIPPDNRYDNCKKISDCCLKCILSEQMFHVVSIICCLLSLVCYVTEFIPLILILCCCKKFKHTHSCLFLIDVYLHLLVFSVLFVAILLIAPVTLFLSLFLLIFVAPYFIVLQRLSMSQFHKW